jgi:hypothetical protein
VDPAAALMEKAPPVLEKLNRVRVSGRRALRKARTPAGQAHEAHRLAGAYATATAALKPVAPASGPLAALPGVLDGAAGAYSKLAGAAERHNRARWKRARAAVNAAEKAVAAQLAAVGTA